jgi:hypothetical protein
LAFWISAGGQTGDPKFSVRSNLVSLPSRVQNKKGETIYGLRPEQFLVEDNGVRQTVNVDEHAILLISEMRDHGSKSKLDEVVDELGITDTTIYSVAFSPGKDDIPEGLRCGDKPPKQPVFRAPVTAGNEWAPLDEPVMTELASLSGGESFSFSSQTGFERALQRISNEDAAVSAVEARSLGRRDATAAFSSRRARLGQFFAGE